MAIIRVLIVDDSPVARRWISRILEEDEGIEVVGESVNGRDAITKVRELKPDIVTMDIEMPVMGGLEAIERIMAKTPVPILVITSVEESQTAFQAISKGALEVLPKSKLKTVDSPDLPRKIKLLSTIKVIQHIQHDKKDNRTAPVIPKTFKLKKSTGKKMVAIASSTGGPKALSILLPDIPIEFPYPIVIAQHISDGFVDGLVMWLARISRLKVQVGKAGVIVRPGNVYISPSEKDMVINHEGIINLTPTKASAIYHPSCDSLLTSVSEVFGSNTLGVILTGMGDDGAKGMQAIKEKGGVTIAQDEASSVIFGMPKVAIDTGAIDKVLPLQKIAGEILESC